MKNHEKNRKNSTLSKNNTISHKNIRTLDNNGQILILMGITLAISVFIISSLSAEISDLDLIVTSERSTSLLPEFTHIRGEFGTALNYNLVSIDVGDNNFFFYGNISDITDAFNQTREEFYVLELQHDTIFNAIFKDCQYFYLSSEGHIYHVACTVSLDDGKTCITKDVVYNIICKRYIPS